ncbi:hypothetical protein [Methylobacterium radiotolerans]
MSTGTGPKSGPPPDYAHIAAYEAQGAHRNTVKLLEIIREGSEEADPIGTIIDGQDRASSRLKQIMELLQAMWAEQQKQAADLTVLRQQVGEIHPVLARARVIPE